MQAFVFEKGFPLKTVEPQVDFRFQTHR